MWGMTECDICRLTLHIHSGTDWRLTCGTACTACTCRCSLANRSARLFCAKAGAASSRLVGSGLGHASAGWQLLRCSGREAGLDGTATL